VGFLKPERSRQRGDVDDEPAQLDYATPQPRTLPWAKIRRFLIPVAIFGWIIVFPALVLIPIFAGIFDISWDANPPLYYVQITPFEISTAGSDFPYWSLGMTFIGIPVFILTASLFATRRKE